MDDRLACLVPFCRCTTRADRIAPDTEWICSKHWRLVPRATKARWRQVKQRHRWIWRRLSDYRVVTRPGPLTIWEATRRQVLATWERCKREAIEGSGGI